ncbi:Hypothetical_protein [Hexamita inflata]|uniref:Hypothetical_protein n=1 Tax=Hexamita inflata TaxID=28002 RepID=A0ABP1IK50_9EUKA
MMQKVSQVSQNSSIILGTFLKKLQLILLNSFSSEIGRSHNYEIPILSKYNYIVNDESNYKDVNFMGSRDRKQQSNSTGQHKTIIRQSNSRYNSIILYFTNYLCITLFSAYSGSHCELAPPPGSSTLKHVSILLRLDIVTGITNIICSIGSV